MRLWFVEAVELGEWSAGSHGGAAAMDAFGF